MTSITRTLVAAAAAAFLLCGFAAAEDPVKIKKWKADPVELLDHPDGRVVATKAAADLPTEAERTGQGWLKINLGGQDYYVESSQARTDLKLNGRPKCENLGGATNTAGSRGYAEEGCRP